MATGAEIIGTAFYYAFGYHTVEVYLAELDPAKLAISPKAHDLRPADRRAARADPARHRRRAAGAARGSRTARYRVLASRFADGKPARQLPLLRHPPRRSERHRPARASPRAARRARVRRLAESRRLARREQPRLARRRGRPQATSSTTCSTSGRSWAAARSTRSGIGRATSTSSSGGPAGSTLATLGLYTRPWLHIDYPDVPPSVGRFEGDAFDAGALEARVSEPGLRQHARRRCVLGGADRGALHERGASAAIVGKAQYSDPRATEYMTATLIKRRDKVLRTWLAGVNPIVDFAHRARRAS